MLLSHRLTPLQQEILRNSLRKSAHLEALNAQLKVVEAQKLERFMGFERFSQRFHAFSRVFMCFHVLKAS